MALRKAIVGETDGVAMISSWRMYWESCHKLGFAKLVEMGFEAWIAHCDHSVTHQLV